MNSEEKDKILFFDGVCNLCNWFIDFSIRRDKSGKIFFSPLQSDIALKKLGPQYTKGLPSVVYFREGEVFSESTAALIVLSDLGGVLALFRVFLIIPKIFRDPVYRWIARNRYRWFGRRETCRLPSEHEKTRFL